MLYIINDEFENILQKLLIVVCLVLSDGKGDDF